MSEIARLSVQALSVHGGRVDDRTGRTQPDFAPVFEETFPVVLRYIVARVGDRALAEDLAGDVFELAVRGWDRFEGRSSARTWVLGIAKHVVSHQRRRTTVRTVPLDVAPADRLHDSSDSPERVAERQVEARLLHRALDGLSIEDQELLALRYAADLSNREISTILGIRDVTTRVRLHRATTRLGRILSHLEETP